MKVFLIIFAFVFCALDVAAQQPPFYNDIQRFKKSDSLKMPPKQAILFTGSSSFTRWTDVQRRFPEYSIINRGFGGSSLPDLIRYAEDVIIKYQPQQVVIYCGENDAAGGNVTADTITARFLTLFGIIRNALPETHISFVSMKPSPSRMKVQSIVKKSNAQIKEFLGQQSNTSYIDVYPEMLDASGYPMKEIFVSDSLHMNEKGYDIWQKIIKPYLKKSSQDSFSRNQFVNAGDTLPYRLLLPEAYDPMKKYPVVLFLHGAGERGIDNEAQLTHGAKLFLEDSNRKKFPAIVIFPQCAPDSYWSNVNITTDQEGKRNFQFSMQEKPTRMMSILLKFVEEIPVKFKIDESRFYVMGLSMGGMGTFEIARRKPARFAAAVPICGGGDPASAKLLKSIPWRIFHGAKDNVVPMEHSEKMVAALKASKARVAFTVYPNAGHNSWDNAFAEPDLLSWIFNQKRK